MTVFKDLSELKDMKDRYNFLFLVFINNSKTIRIPQYSIDDFENDSKNRSHPYLQLQCGKLWAETHSSGTRRRSCSS